MQCRPSGSDRAHPYTAPTGPGQSSIAANHTTGYESTCLCFVTLCVTHCPEQTTPPFFTGHDTHCSPSRPCPRGPDDRRGSCHGPGSPTGLHWSAHCGARCTRGTRTASSLFDVASLPVRVTQLTLRGFSITAWRVTFTDRQTTYSSNAQVGVTQEHYVQIPVEP